MVDSIKSAGLVNSASRFKSEDLRSNLKKVSAGTPVRESQGNPDTVDLSARRAATEAAAAVNELSRFVSNENPGVSGAREKLRDFSEFLDSKTVDRLESSLDSGADAFRVEVERVLIERENLQSSQSRIADIETALRESEQLRESILSGGDSALSAVGDLDPEKLRKSLLE